MPLSRRSRTLGVISLTAVLALLAAACGGDSDSGNGSPQPDDSGVEVAANPDNCPADALESADGPIDITVWHAYTGQTTKALEDAAAAYNASQDQVTVSVDAQGSYPELLKKYEDTLGTPSDLPDVVFSEDTTLQFMVNSGSVIAASDCIAADDSADEFYDNLLPVVENAYTVSGLLWPASFGASMPVMYVNRDHLRAAGLPTDELPETLEEVRAAAETLGAANIPGVEAPVVIQLYGWYPENWITGARQEIVNGGNGRDELATESLFDNEVTHEVIGWLDSMHDDGLLKAYAYSSDISQFLAMGNGSSSILIDGSRAITTIDAVVSNASAGQATDIEGVDVDGIDIDLEGLDVTVAPIPGVEAAGQGTVWGSAGFLVAGADDARVAAGWDFLKFFNSPEQQAQWTIKGSYLPVTTTVQEAQEILDHFSATRAGQWLATVNEQLLDADPDFPGPAMGPYNEFRSGLHSMLEAVVLGDTPVAEGIESFNADVQNALERYAAEVG